MKCLIKFSLTFFLSLVFYLLSSNSVFAIEDPKSLPNNKFGIHILFVDEITDAAKLVNCNGGEWGYVTIPIQAGDKNMEKWQKFMDLAKTYKVIPIIRLASEGDYFNTKVWRKPTANDILDFANFLNSLNWPVKNRYIIVFNEVNRGDEWGGSPNVAEYVDLLNYASVVFKARSDDFFLISAGLDNAAANVSGVSINQYNFLEQMFMINPDIFKQVDGLSSHSYPNPAFSQPPYVQTRQSITSFKYERQLVKSLSGKDLPVFITETNWSKEFVAEKNIAAYLKTAFTDVWSDENVIAVTPFIFKANMGPFVNFSFLGNDGLPNENYKAIEALSKNKGKPTLSVKPSEALQGPEDKVLGEKNFSRSDNPEISILKAPYPLKLFFKWLLKI